MIRFKNKGLKTNIYQFMGTKNICNFEDMTDRTKQKKFEGRH